MCQGTFSYITKTWMYSKDSDLTPLVIAVESLKPVTNLFKEYFMPILTVF